MSSFKRITLNSTSDILTARLRGRELAIRLGFDGFDVTRITDAISNLAKLVVHHSRRGEMCIEEVRQGTQSGIKITAQAESPLDRENAEAASASQGPVQELEAGVPNLQGLMDELMVASNKSGDTTIIMKRWKGHS